MRRRRGKGYSSPAEHIYVSTGVLEVRKRFVEARTPAIPTPDKYHVEI